MKKNILSATMIAVVLIGLVACGQKSKSDEQDSNVIDIHNSMNSLDWNGTYAGIIPCADCEGISVSITLNPDETYMVSYMYLGKDDSFPISFSGKFSWNEAGNTIKLDIKDFPPYYFVGENRLIQLDMDGNEIVGELADNYILEKMIECSLPK